MSVKRADICMSVSPNITEDSVDILGSTTKGEVHFIDVRCPVDQRNKTVSEHTRYNTKQRFETDYQTLI